MSPRDPNGTAPSVLFIVDDVPPAVCGVGDYSAHLVKNLIARGCSVTVLTKVQPNITSASFGAGAVVRPVIRNWGYADILTVLREVWAMPSGSIVHVQYDSCSNYNRRTMINLLPALLRILSVRTRVVVTMHGFHERRRRFRFRATPMLLAAHHCIFVTRRDYDLASRTLGIRNRSGLVSIASNIPSIPLLESDRRVTRETIGIAETDRVILFFGDFHEKKGVLQLLLAASDARRRVPNLKLVLVGGLGEKHRTQSRQYAQRLDEAIERARSEGFLVTVHNPDAPRVARLIRAAELAVFPFLDGASENRGSMLAAIANETATLTTSGRSTPDGFANEFGVDVVTAGNVHDLAARIIDLLLDPDLLGDLRKRTALAARRILWDGVADRHIQIYQSLEC